MTGINSGKMVLWKRGVLFFFSFLLVAFGQPAWNEWIGLLSACLGFACFFRFLIEVPEGRFRFLIAMGWFGGVQLIQLSWFLSHPYLYIYGVTLFCALLMGVQCGIIAIWITPQAFRHVTRLFALAGLWTLFEWSRLFIFSGLPFNPVGLALTGSIYPLQLASFGGVYALSFWVILSNLLLVRAWLEPRSLAKWAVAVTAIILPYFLGWSHLQWHEEAFVQNNKKLNAILVQPAIPVEESDQFQSAEEKRQALLERWRTILATLSNKRNHKADLIVFPEYVVPYGIRNDLFSYREAKRMLNNVFGDVSHALPSKHSSYIHLYGEGQESEWWVSNGYIIQTVANLFQAHVVVGLEESLKDEEGRKTLYSSAFHVVPERDQEVNRYDKRVLVPMGEYIPFAWCRDLAARYGVSGSFTCGTAAQIFDGLVPFGASICYEEMYGDLMRENRIKGAELLVNLTNDGWYPNSRLPKQHFDHARLRSVENGIPLVRACNTGVTGAVDSLGRVIAVLGEDPLKRQQLSDSLSLSVPLYHYKTLYARFGDSAILIFSLLCIAAALFFKSRRLSR